MLLEVPETFGKEIAEIIDRAIDNAIAPLIKRINKLEEHIDRLLLIPAKLAEFGDLQYLGVWEPGQKYERGNFVTLNGAMWHCERPTTSRPGTDSTFKMAVKSAGR